MLVVLAIALAFVLGDRSSQFRVDAITDSFSGEAATELNWGVMNVEAREGDPAVCARAATTIPAGAAMTGARDRDGVAYIQVVATAPARIDVRCADEAGRRQSGNLTFRASAKPPTPVLIPAFNAERPLAADLKPTLVADKPTSADQTVEETDSLAPIIPVRLRNLVIGGVVDEKGPAEAFDILRSGRIVSDVHSIPYRSSSVLVERTLDTGDIVTFDNGRNDDQAQGLVILGQRSIRLLARTRAESSMITRPGSDQGDIAIVAPTFLARLQAQAEWGVFVVIGVVFLNILAAIPGYLPLAHEGRRSFRWARKRGGLPAMLSIAGSLLLAAAPKHVAAQPASGHPAFLVSVGKQQGQGFAIQNPKGAAPNCLIITAGHVVAPGDDVALLGWIDGRNWKGDAIVREEFSDDIAILAPKTDIPGGCEPFPMLRPYAAQILLEGDTPGRVTYVRAGTGSTFVRASAEVIDARTARITSLVAGSGVEPTFSGALFSIAGTPLGMVQTISDGAATVLRLDYAATIVRRYIAASTPPAYATSYMPAEFQKVVKDATDLKGFVDQVRAQAKENERRALEAARMSATPTAGYGQILPNRQIDRIYEGQINAAGNSGEGYGVVRFQSGPEVGKELRGIFRSTSNNTYGLTGSGVMIYGADLSNERVRFEGEFDEKGAFTGVGAISWRDGVVSSARFVRGEANGPAIREFSDGQRLDAVWKDSFIDGFGVLWSPQGQPVCICLYRKGQLMEDRTQEILRKR